MNPSIVALSKNPVHHVSKQNVPELSLLAGQGVEGDAHFGKLVQHRSRITQNPRPPNLRQVHLIHAELLEELRQKGFDIQPGQMGENITTSGIDLLGLSANAILQLGQEVKIQITGLRNPCSQLDGLQPGLMKAVLDRDPSGNLIRKAGVMGIVLKGGPIKVGDPIRIISQPTEKIELDRV